MGSSNKKFMKWSETVRGSHESSGQPILLSKDIQDDSSSICFGLSGIYQIELVCFLPGVKKMPSLQLSLDNEPVVSSILGEKNGLIFHNEQYKQVTFTSFLQIKQS